MFRIQITGGAPGAPDLEHAYESRAQAERVAHAIVCYLERNRLPDHLQGVRVLDERGRWIWRQVVGSEPERVN